MSQSITAKIRENTADILKQEGRPLAIREIKERLAGRGITDYRSGHLAGGLIHISGERTLSVYRRAGGRPGRRNSVRAYEADVRAGCAGIIRFVESSGYH